VVEASNRSDSAVTICLTRQDLSHAFDDFAKDIYWFCRRALDTDTDAEDLMSIVFLEAWRCRNRAFLLDGSLKPWLFGIARNVTRSRRRSLVRYRKALSDFRAEYESPVESDPADTVVARLDASDTSRQISLAIDRLGKRDREVVVAVLLKGLSTQRAAQELGISESAVKSRLGRARRQLRQLLRPSESPTKASLIRSSNHLWGERQSVAPIGRQSPTRRFL
jgi:RNA polymerase sigma factor (sigma-70 family)